MNERVSTSAAIGLPLMVMISIRTIMLAIILLVSCISSYVDAFSSYRLRPHIRVASTSILFRSSRHVSPTSTLFSSLQQLDDNNARDLLFKPADGKAVIVDAYAPWCGPCKLIEPYVIECAKKYSEKLSFIKYDVEGDNNSNLKIELLLQGARISGLPTLMIYQDGKPLAQHSGMITQQGLEDWLDANLFSKNLDSTTNIKPAKEGNATNDTTTDNKRGFVSFASGGIDDDYMLSN